ncbi:MAG: hypothetical protein HOD35_01290 [Euryarchaeota archaeon]|jgi:hypothetical protein|nr:hypothetical protein [Euryarchaeota archaeon]MBT4391272.1 hypothetical protein [Euryarchaeota archaeon]MBT4802521.1 hypothetical protein [Euryarchaeota archaeon]MBT6683363.1 hypothetical protein [Euryarchaeota archaeon]MBT6874649.1 hypothetical protein [Euryarchaeota archaeon]
MDIELDANIRTALLISTAVLVVFELLNMTGTLGSGDKLFLIDFLGIGSNEAFRPDTGFSTQDLIGFILAGIMGAVWFLSKEDDLDWEALLADDEEE